MQKIVQHTLTHHSDNVNQENINTGKIASNSMQVIYHKLVWNLIAAEVKLSCRESW